MNQPAKHTSLKWRFLSLVFVLAGAICLAAHKPTGQGKFPAIVVCGMGLMIVGVVIRLTARRF